MIYPEELRERYNEVMYDERDIIEKFLRDQYDIRYGRQRDTWHFETAIEMIARQGSTVTLTDIELNKDSFVNFIVDTRLKKGVILECLDFAYGELSKVIEALPDAGDILVKNAKDDIAEMCNECSINLEDNPFKAFVNGKALSIYSVHYDNGHIRAYTYTGKDVMDETNTGLVLGLRNHINIEVLHRSEEYKKVMELLSLEPNLRKSVDEYDKTHYGLVTFVIEGTDMEFDVSAIQQDDKGNLTIFGADTGCEDELITLTEKEIRKEYIVEILKWLKSKYTDIMDTYNSHNPELVRKINDAWKNDGYHKLFGTILLALLYRDNMEYEQKFGEILDYSEEYAMEHAHEIMEGVCDDQDLETILSFIRYEE